MPDFATTESETRSNFIVEYAQFLQGGPEPAALAVWLKDHAKEMREDMFLDTRVNWGAFQRVDVLALRAISPEGVFTNFAKGAFLTQVDNNPVLKALADMLFRASDVEFLSNLPSDLKERRAFFGLLIDMATRIGLRR